MVYMGSKNKYSLEIVSILQDIINKNNIQVYVEPFVGGANIIDKIHCDKKFGFDKNKSLIELHTKAQENFDEIPETSNAEWWYEAKDLYRKFQGSAEIEKYMPLWKVGAIQFLGSFSNGGFSRGYAKPSKGRDPYNEAYRNLKRQSEQEEYKNIIFDSGDYKIWPVIKNSLVYCDPPYEGTKPYGYAFETKFNHKEYWDWVREASKIAFVVVSEQNLPEDFDIIWQKEVKRTTNKSNDFKATEKLGFYKNGLLQI